MRFTKIAKSGIQIGGDLEIIVIDCNMMFVA